VPGSAPAFGRTGVASAGERLGRKVQVQHQEPEVVAGPQWAQRRLVAVRGRVALARLGGPRIVKKPVPTLLSLTLISCLSFFTADRKTMRQG
jgi:hypothetical protein